MLQYKPLLHLMDLNLNEFFFFNKLSLNIFLEYKHYKMVFFIDFCGGNVGPQTPQLLILYKNLRITQYWAKLDVISKKNYAHVDEVNDKGKIPIGPTSSCQKFQEENNYKT